MPPDAALKRMLDGNAVFVSRPETCVVDFAQKRKATAAGQKPYGIVLGCADSRVEPELLFGGMGPGELFIARNAGNLADDIIIGTLEYGALMLGASVVMVLGHERCGAVIAACELIEKNSVYPASIEALVQPILPAALAVRDKPGNFVENAMRESARRTAGRIVERSRVLGGLVDAGKLKIVSAAYDLDTGRVSLL